MRRLPIYFLVDVSESMVGGPIEEINDGMRHILQDLRQDPYALETVFVSIIAFAGRSECLLPLTELTRCTPPKFPIGSGTSLGRALTFLMSELDRSIQKTTQQVKGDWKPIIFLFTDGVPTDDVDSAIAHWNSTWRNRANLIAISIGRYGDTTTLRKLTDNVLMLSETDASSFQEYFKWISASIKSSSVSVNEYYSDDLRLPSISGINLEKVDSNTECIIDENYAVISAKCSSTQNLYLIKYGKNGEFCINIDGYNNIEDIDDKYKLIGAYPVDMESYTRLSEQKGKKRIVSSDLLIGSPKCPYCNAAIGMVQCGGCGEIYCHDGDSEETTCAWCGMTGKLTLVKHLDYSREKG